MDANGSKHCVVAKKCPYPHCGGGGGGVSIKLREIMFKIFFVNGCVVV